MELAYAAGGADAGSTIMYTLVPGLVSRRVWSPHLVTLGGRFFLSLALFNGLVASLGRLGWSLHLITFPG